MAPDTPVPPDLTAPMLRHHHRLHRAALWLALSAVVLRSLIPIGFMPGWIGAVPGSPSWLVICPASELQALLKPSAHQAAERVDGVPKVALRSPARIDGVPDSPHCSGQAVAAVSPVSPIVSVALAVAGDHRDHDQAQHAGHRIAAEHQNCPFAGAATPALALAATAALPYPAATTVPDVVRQPAAMSAAPRRLPPARAPPARFDDRAEA